MAAVRVLRAIIQVVGRIGRFVAKASTADRLSNESVIRPGAADGLPIRGYLTGQCGRVADGPIRPTNSTAGSHASTLNTFKSRFFFFENSFRRTHHLD